MTTRCEIPTPDGRCDEPATGRCGGCGRSFCDTHQAADRSGGKVLTMFADECIDCFAAPDVGD